MNLPLALSVTLPVPAHIVEKGEILTLCCLEYTGTVRYHGPIPGTGCHGGQLVAVQLLEALGQPTISVDAARLVIKECCMNGWGTA